MRVDIPLEIDLGPLAWVKDEVTQSLDRARKAIDSLLAPSDEYAEHAQRALDELHQVQGAFELIGIEGLSIYAREIERHLKFLVDEPSAATAPQVVAGVERAIRRLCSHLEEVFSGAPCKPTMLAREYAALHRLRGSDAGAADLFFPDLNRKPPKLEGAQPIPADRVPAYVQVARRAYERGLLAWLRNDVDGLIAMREQVQAIERAFPLPAQRSFWWTVGALFHAIEEQSVLASVGVKQLAGRIDLQIRRFVEGTTKVSDRLRREVLFHIGRAVSERDEVKAVQSLYELERLLPGPGVSLRGAVDYVALRPAIDALSGNIQEMRASWQRVVTGHSEEREVLRKQCVIAARQADELDRPQLANLLSTLGQELPPSTTETISDAFAVEFSGSLLFAETALSNFAGNATDYESEATALTEQINAAAAGLDALSDVRATPAITRRAQERESFKALVTEVRENLVFAETSIDGWVRGQSELDTPAIAAKLSQTVAVFDVSDQAHAASSVRQIEAALATLDPKGLPSEQAQTVAQIAEMLSVLGFYVDAKRLQPNADHTYLLTQGGARARDPKTDDDADESQLPSASVEIDVSRQRKQLANLIAQWQLQPADVATRTQVEASLHRLLDDAKLLGNAELVSSTREALNAIAVHVTSAVSATTAIALTQSIATGDTLPVPTVSVQTQELLAKAAPERDDALVEIYLEETDEILGNLDAMVQALRLNPSDRESLVSTRRSFHTLKGSGRMVGLHEMGSAAWDVERYLNTKIQNEANLNAADIALIEAARVAFGQWAAQVRSVGSDNQIVRTKLDEALLKVGADISVPTAQLSVPSNENVHERVGAQQPFQDTRTLARPVPELSATALDVRDESTRSLDSFLDRMEADDLQNTLEVGTIASVAVAAASAPITGLGLASLSHATEAQSENAPPPNTSGRSPVAPTSTHDQILSASTSLELDTVVGPLSLHHGGVESVEQTVNLRNARLPDTLRAIVTEEADTHLHTLSGAVERMQFEANLTPSDEMIRAAHTLKGMHLSVGLNDIGELAGELEAALVALKDQSAPEEALPAIATAVAALQSLCQCVRDQIEPDPADLDFVEIARASLAQLHNGKPDLSADRLVEKLALNTTPDNEPIVDSNILSPDFVFAQAAADASDAEDADAIPVALIDQPLVAVPSNTNELTQEVARVESERGEPVASVDRTAGVSGLTASSAEVDVEAKVNANPSAAVLAPIAMVGAVAATGLVTGASTVSNLVHGGVSPTPTVNPATIADQIPIAPTTFLATTTPQSDPLADIRDDLEPAVLGIFLEEAHELFPTAGAQLRQWRATPQDVTTLNALKRTMHTLKGSARMAGAMRLGELAHRIESRLETDGFSRNISAAAFDGIEAELDSIAYLLDRLEKGEANVSLPGFESSIPAVQSQYGAVLVEARHDDEPVPAELLVAGAAIASDIAERPAAELVVDSMTSMETREAVAPAASAPAAPATLATAIASSADALRWLETENASQAQILRVKVESIERLADETGEVSISRARMESELRALRLNLNELTSSVTRLRGQVREIEIQAETQIQSRLSQVQESDTGFDPLEFDRFTRFQELTRSLAEGVNDVATVQQSIVSNLDTTDSALNAQGRIARSLQNQLQSIRTVAFNSLRERLYRVLRQTARDLGKRANMEIRGGDLSIDRSVLERLAPLVEHVLRNALAHGIEVPSARLSSGKSETGEISVDLKQHGNLVEVSISDDGRGFDIAAIQAKAIAQGLVTSGQQRTTEQWLELVFLSGFTTANEVSNVAGRGVGMDVVRTELAAFGGRVEARHEVGKGARFVLTVPLTLSVLNTVMVRVGKGRFGIPASMVETVKAVRASELDAARASGMMQHARESIRFASMHRRLGETLVPREETVSQVIVVRSGASVLALDVDAVLGNQEVVLKRMGPQISRVAGLLGVTLMGDGEIVLLYNPIALMSEEVASGKAAAVSDAPAKVLTVTPLATAQAITPQPTSNTTSAPKFEAPAPARGVVVPIRPSVSIAAEKPLVMVVDDSLTVRKITTRFLEREGFRAISAKDGMEALTMLSDHKPGVILLDIEMPRMDGFEFTRAMKGDAALRSIPIIMITSRTAEKHRNHAKELGVNVYLGKPYQDDELLQHIESFVQRAVTV